MAQKSKSVPPKSQSAPQKFDKGSVKSKPTPRPKGTRRDEKPSLGEVPISPKIILLSEIFNKSNCTTDPASIDNSYWNFFKVPLQLAPFVRNPTFETLLRILADSGLAWMYYSHPIVQEQVRFLVSRLFHYEDWILGAWDSDSPPKSINEFFDKGEQARITEALQSLVKAHSKAFFPSYKIEWKPIKKPGRHGTERIHNPHPTWDCLTTIYDSTLYSSFHYLKAAIVNQLGEKLANWPEKPDSEKINDLKFAITWVLNEAGPDWTGLKKFNPESKQSMPQCYSWDLPQFDEILRTFQTTNETTLGKEGRPACLTYSILGQFLGITPDEIRNLVNYYERSKDPLKTANVASRKQKSSS